MKHSLPLPAGAPVTTRSRAIALVAGSGAMLVFALSAAILPAALLRVARELNVTTITVTRLMALQFTTFCCATLVSGIVGERIGKVTVIKWGTFIVAAGSFTWYLAPTIAHAALAAMLLGIGGGVLEALGTALVADLFPHRRKAVINTMQVAYSLGATGGPGLMAWLLPRGVSWRLFFAVEGLLALLLLALYFGVSEGRRTVTGTTGFRDLMQPLRQGYVWLLALAVFGYVLAESGVGVGAALYLQTQLVAPERWAIMGITLLWGGTAVGRIVCSLLPEEWPTERLVLGLALISITLLLLQHWVDHWRFSLLLFAGSGFFFAGIWPMLVALAAATQSGRSGSVVGVVVAIGALGVIVAPLVLGQMVRLERLDLFYPLVSLGLLLTMLCVILSRFKRAA